MATKTVADLLVQTLAAAGVERVYGVSGDSLNGITDSIRRQKQIQWIHMRHEEAAAFQCSRSQLRSPAAKLAAVIFKKPTRNTSLHNVATTANRSRIRSRCRVLSRLRSRLLFRAVESQ